LFCSNAFQVAIFNMTGKRALKVLYESYGQQYDSYTDFRKYLLENTSNHQFIWYDARNESSTVEKRYKIVHCPEKIPEFEMKFNTKH
jgi:hypothetical protein